MKTLVYPLACFAGLAIGQWALCFHDATSQSGTSRTDLARLREGTHLFRNIFGSAGVKPLEKFDDLRTEPQKKLLIVVGDPSVLYEPGRETALAQFIAQGGAFLLATNASGRFPLGHMIYIAGGGQVRQRSESAYGGHIDCPFVQSTEAGQPLFRDAKPKRPLNRVVTFQPGYLRTRLLAEPLSVMAAFPKDCYLDFGPASPAVMPFIIGGPMGPGRILVLSDHHVFLNAVLWQFDNTDNVNFACNCVHWLTESESGKRDQALFLENGHAQTKFNVPLKYLPPPPLPPLEAVVQAVDDGLVGLEEEDHFNGLIRSAFDAIPEEALIKVVVAILTVGLALFGLSRLSHARHRFEPSIPHLSESLAQLVPTVSVIEQRHRALLREGNFWETAQSLARQVFDSALGHRLAAEEPALPPMHVEGSWRQRARLRRQVRELWRLALGDEPERLSSGQLARLSAAAAAVKVALAEGRLRLGP